MSDNVLDHIRNKRNRATVEPREDALVPKVQQSLAIQAPEEPLTQPTPVEEQQSPAQESLVSPTQQAEQSPLKLSSVEKPENPTTTESGDASAALIAELKQYPETKRHSAIVLEKDLDQKLTQFCKDRGITVETFLEAAWTVASGDNTLMEKITTEAKRRYDQRKRVGQLKRLITMLGNSSK